MNMYVEKERYKNVIRLYESLSSKDKESLIDNIKRHIVEASKLYYTKTDEEEKKQIFDSLIDDYNVLDYYAKKNHRYQEYFEVISSIPYMYLLEQKPERFNINEELLDSINIQEGLTMEQAIELLKWTANNTRDNLNKEIANRNENGDVYDNESLGGACGLSQFLSLYPLQQMGFKITINNMRNLSGYPHAYGTVTIPIKEGNQIVQKCFLIDCTYRQFFTLDSNVYGCYNSMNENTCTPGPGFFAVQDKENIDFSNMLLKDGFFEMTPENIENYFKPFYLVGVRESEIAKEKEEFKKINIFDHIENNQEEFDYDEEELEKWGMNLQLPNNQNVRK